MPEVSIKFEELTDWPGQQKIAILGSTGSVGCSTLAVIRQHPEKFKVLALAAGSNAQLLNEQIAEFQPAYAACADTEAYSQLRASGSTELSAGAAAVCDLAALAEADIIVAAISGNAGLESTLAALNAGKRVALANKESLVCAGPFIADLLKQTGASIVPVDSEHSALFQCLQGERRADLKRLILTASGGPFWNLNQAELDQVTPARALKHPNWSMGAKITIDSATLMNKALEVIEAYWLFGVDLEQIDVVVHPQSIIHSLVEFIDHTQIAQLSVPDMQGAIAYALAYPHGRLTDVMRTLDLTTCGSLEFHKLNETLFPAIQLARESLQAGGMAATVLNLANEQAVNLFLKEKIKFTDILQYTRRALDKWGHLPVSSIEDLLVKKDNIQKELLRD